MTEVKFFFALLLLSTGNVLAREPELNALQLLVKMNHAMEVLNYQGTVAFFKNNKLEPMKYIHAAAKGVQQERLLSLNSPLREITRDAGKVSCETFANPEISPMREVNVVTPPVMNDFVNGRRRET